MKTWAKILFFGVVGFVTLVGYATCETDCAERCNGHGVLVRDWWSDLPACVCEGGAR